MSATGTPSGPGRTIRRSSGLREGLRAAVATCLVPSNLRRTSRIALVVGCVLTGINQGDVIAGGHATAVTGVKVGMNFVVPFVVSNLGVVAGTRTARR